MSANLTPIITLAGLKAVFNDQKNGLDATIVEIALGDSGWTPDNTATALKNEKRRIPVRGELVNDSQIHLTGVEDGTSLEYWVREVGFYLEDGTLLAIWSNADQPLAYKSASVDLLLAFDLVLSALPANSVTVDGSAGFSLPPATDSKRGLIRIATQTEITEGTSKKVAINPAQLTELKNQIGLQNDNGIIKDLKGVVLGNLVQYKIYKDTTTGIQEVMDATTPFPTSLKISFTPKYSDSLIVVRASGNFRALRTSIGVCGMAIQLYDGSVLLNEKMGFLFNSYATSIHHNPNMLHVDNRDGTTMRNYNLALIRHINTIGTSLSYYPSYGQGSISVEEYQSV